MKKLITVALLLFVVVSIVAVVVKERRGGADSNLGSATAGVVQKDKTIVYYFHGNKRCVTCKKIEVFTCDAVNKGFSEMVKEGALELRIVNLDQSANEHFVKDYQLTTRSVVLSKIKDGKEINWERLDRVWDLVDDESAFIEYVSKEINTIMQGKSL